MLLPAGLPLVLVLVLVLAIWWLVGMSSYFGCLVHCASVYMYICLCLLLYRYIYIGICALLDYDECVVVMFSQKWAMMSISSPVALAVKLLVRERIKTYGIVRLRNRKPIRNVQ